MRNQSQQPKRICEYFMAKGVCKYGEQCRFSHIKPTEEGSTSTDERPQALLFTLKGIMRAFSRERAFDSVGRFQDFVNLTVKILDSDDREAQSDAVLLLSNADERHEDTGLDLIRHVVEQVGLPASESHRLFRVRINPLQNLDYEQHVIPFMKILVHDGFSRNCVEKSLQLVIKTVYGPDGERGANFLKRVVGMLENTQDECKENPELENIIQEGCFLVSRILNYFARYNADAIGHGDLMDLHSKLKVIAAKVRNPFSARTERCLSETAAYLIPVVVNPTTAQTISSDTPGSLHDRYYQRELLIDLPGELSTLYRRHDNDHKLIKNISILPTKEEMRCSRDPYLPINDVAAPHFLEGSSRLFDISFRLLREDMIGPLRNAVAAILEKITSGTSISKQFSKVNQRDPHIASTRFYFGVTVESAQFDKKCGLKFRLRFRQPNLKREPSEEARKSYWEATRSLDKGSLLCLISDAPDFICFLTVVEKQLNLLQKDSTWCFIDVIPEGKTEFGHEQLLRFVRDQGPSGALALVEFPGVLLVAYKTILESLQARSIRPFLPFSNILSPKPEGRQTYDPADPNVHVPPPLYASSEDFLFDLKRLKRSDASEEPLFLSPKTSHDDKDFLLRLERETTLDSGQCKGFIAALTREVSLIQGVYPEGLSN